MIIDAHHHLWHYEPSKYAWIDDRMGVLRQDFTTNDLAAEIEGIVDGVIAVQARQDVDETLWLLDEARETPFVLGVVGWAPLTAADVEDEIARLAEDPALVGIRHVLQDERDDAFMLRPDFNRGIEALAPFGLVYDVLVYERHLGNVLEFVDRHPEQTFVLDHIGKPRIGEGPLDPWRANLRRLAEREHCYCKVSGMVTEASWTEWTVDGLSPYLDTVFEAFGPRRLMFGSDWPVCLLACEYRRWYHIVEDYTSELSQSEYERFWGGTAAEAYRLAV